MGLCFRPVLLFLISLIAVALSTKADELAEPAAKPLKPKKTVWMAEIQRTAGPPQITGLEVSAAKIPVVLIPKEGRFRPMVEIHGHYLREGWTLLIQDKIPVTRTENPSEFVIYAYLNSAVSEVSLTARGPQGESEQELFLINAPEVQEFKVISPWEALQVSTGVSYLRYSQSGYSNFNSLNGRIGAKYLSPKSESMFGLLMDVNVTVLTFSSGPVKGNPQVLEGKMDGTIQVPGLTRGAWSTDLIAGGSYATMFSNGMGFGFSNLAAPEVGFITKFAYNKKEVFISEFRFVPFDAKSLLEQRGLGLNLLWSWSLPNLHRAEGGLALASYKYNPTPTSNVEITLASFVFSYSL